MSNCFSFVYLLPSESFGHQSAETVVVESGQSHLRISTAVPGGLLDLLSAHLLSCLAELFAFDIAIIHNKQKTNYIFHPSPLSPLPSPLSPLPSPLSPLPSPLSPLPSPLSPLPSPLSPLPSPLSPLPSPLSPRYLSPRYLSPRYLSLYLKLHIHTSSRLRYRLHY